MLKHVRTVNVKSNESIDRRTGLVAAALRLVDAQKGQHKLDEVRVELDRFAGAKVLARGYPPRLYRPEEEEACTRRVVISTFFIFLAF